MHLKNILAAFTIAGLATASPVADIEARAPNTCSAGGSHAWCCATAFPLNIFFIQGVGSNCVQATSGTTNGAVTYSCPSTKPNFLCCAQNQIPNGGNVVCTT